MKYRVVRPAIAVFSATAVFIAGAASARQPAAKTPAAPAAAKSEPASKEAPSAAQPGKGKPLLSGKGASPLSAQKPTPPGAAPTPAAHGQPPAPPQGTIVLKPGEVPKVEFDTPSYDFGRVKAGSDILHDFWFTNTGTGPLEIIAVKPSCGCTTTGQFDRVVQPGATGKIPIKIAAAHYSGQITKSITINTNAPGAETTALQVRGELWQLIQATPSAASFGRLTPESASGAALIRKLTIVNNTESPAVLGKITSTSPSFKAEANSLETGKKFELTVTLVPPFTPGALSAQIEIATGLTDMPKLSIPASAYFTADLEVTPNTLAIPATRTATLQRQLYVRNNATAPVKISDLKVTSGKVKADIQETQPGVSYKISLDFPADYQVPKEGDAIVFRTSNAATPTMSIPITPLAMPQQPAPKPALGSAAPATPLPNPTPRPSGH